MGTSVSLDKIAHLTCLTLPCLTPPRRAQPAAPGHAPPGRARPGQASPATPCNAPPCRTWPNPAGPSPACRAYRFSFSKRNSFIAPSGILRSPDSHRAQVRGVTSTCRAACASDRPSLFRHALSSVPVMLSVHHLSRRFLTCIPVLPRHAAPRPA